MKLILFIIVSIGIMFSNDISGVAYFNYSEDSGFGLSRTYFTYKSEISDELSFKFQTDIGQLSESEEDLAEDYRWTAYLKKAQLDWKVNDGMKISMGMIGMNMFNVQENTWGNRFVAKSAMDINKYSSSADLGFAIFKKLGPIAASLLISNGEGYKNSRSDENTKKSLQLLYGEKRLDKNDGYNVGIVYSSLCDNSHDCLTVSGLFGGWSGSNIRLGAESNTKEIGSMSANLTSIYANYSLNDNSSIFVRIDSNDPDSNVDDDESDTKWIGFKWAPTKGLDICPTLVRIDDDRAGNEYIYISNKYIDTMTINFQFKF